MFYSRPSSQLRGSLRYGNKKLTDHLVRVRVAGNLGRDAAGGEKVIAPIYQLARHHFHLSIYLRVRERERRSYYGASAKMVGWPKEREKTRSVNISDLIVSGRRFRVVVNMKSPCTIRFCNLCYVQKLIKTVLSAECFSGLL